MCVYYKPRGTKKSKQSFNQYTQKAITNWSRWNPKTCLNSPQESKTKEKEKQQNGRLMPLHINYLILNVNDLNTHINKNDQKKKYGVTICCLQKICFKVTMWVGLRGGKIHNMKTFTWKKKSGYIKISDKTDFRAKEITEDKEGHYIMTKGSIHQEVIIILNVYTPHNGVSKCMKQKGTGEIDKSTIIVGGLPHFSFSNWQKY